MPPLAGREISAERGNVRNGGLLMLSSAYHFPKTNDATHNARLGGSMPNARLREKRSYS
jgi:hypothetical protein